MMWSGVPVVFMIIFNLYYAGTHAPKYGLVMTGLTAACVPFLSDLIQLISGVSFIELSEKWDSLETQQKYLWVLGIVIVFILVLFAIIPIIEALWR